MHQTGHLPSENRWLYSTFWNSIPWPFWEFPNLLPYGRLRRRTFKCFSTAKTASTTSNTVSIYHSFIRTQLSKISSTVHRTGAPQGKSVAVDDRLSLPLTRRSFPLPVLYRRTLLLRRLRAVALIVQLSHYFYPSSSSSSPHSILTVTKALSSFSHPPANHHHRLN